MSRNDLRIVDSGGRTANPVIRFRVPAASSAILAGEPVQIRTTISGDQTIGFYPIVLSDAQAAGTFYFLGIASADGTHTASADGFVQVYLDIPGTVYGAQPVTADAADTQEEIDTRQFYRLNINLASSRFTVDSDTTDAKAGAFVVVGGDAEKDEIWFVAQDASTWRNWGRAAIIT